MGQVVVGLDVYSRLTFPQSGSSLVTNVVHLRQMDRWTSMLNDSLRDE